MKRKYSTAFADPSGLIEPLMKYRFSPSYRRTAGVIRRGLSRLNPFSRRRRSSTAASGGRVSYNDGYHIIPRRAVNAKRRKYSRKSRIRSLRRNKIRRAGISGKLLSRVWKRMSLLTEAENGKGTVALQNCLNSTGARHLPLHVYDISNCDTNTVNTAFQLIFSPTAAPNTKQYYLFNSVPGKQLLDGETTSNVYHVYSQPSCLVVKDTTDSVNTNKWYWEDFKAELMMYGQKDRDTLYRIDIVRFTDESFIQAMNSSTAGDEVNYAFNAADWNQFWHSMISPYTQNPLIRRYRMKSMKILKTYKFKIPESSSSFDQQPCVKTSIRVPMNRIINRYWHKATDQPTSTKPFDPEDAAAMNAVNNETTTSFTYGGGFAPPKVRTFMIIRATNGDGAETLGTDGMFNVAQGEMPTYDLSYNSRFVVNT